PQTSRGEATPEKNHGQRGASSGVVGYLMLWRRGGDLTRQERGLLTQLAPQIGLGLANGLLVLETEALATYQSMLLDQTTVMLNSLDAQGRVVRWNRASEQLLGFSEEQAHNQRFGIEVARSPDPESWQDFWQELLERHALARELMVTDVRGARVPLHVEARVLRESDSDTVRGAVLVGLDLRHRRALEDQVLKSQKLAAVGLLAAGIAHEINNPLTGVVGYSKLLLEKQLDPRIRQMVEKISVSGERCRKIVEGVLLFSRQKDGVRRTFDLCQLIERVVSIGEYQWRMHNVTVLRELMPGPVQLVADADQIEQVLLNLCSNAVDAMPRGGTLQIALTRHDAQTLRLSVTDDGVGIPDEVKARIFDPFFSTKEIGKGTGLGLAISYGIIK
ncbi:MAG: two-component system sensor histidine kinase NtrB, partial [Nannocystaceae bacterium]